MRKPVIALLCFGLLGMAGGLGLGQERPVPPRDSARLTDLQRQIASSGQRGAEWLFRMNDVKGRFDYGQVPALAASMEGDHLLRQIAAAAALAHAARFTGEERYAIRATQAILALLDDTTVDPKDSTIRYSAYPNGLINRVAAAGLLLQAINNLPTPQADLLDKSEQLANYIRHQARPDGSLACSERGDDGKFPADEPIAVRLYPGEALLGLLRSQRSRPAPWKLELVRAALPCYRRWWKDNRQPGFAPSQSAAWAEFHAMTKDPAAAAFVMEMNEAVCGLQYEQIDPRRQLWYGGFMGWSEGRPADMAPDIGSAEFVRSLAAACKVAREMGDVAHHERFTTACERGFQFLVTLQYSDGNTRHFAPWYRERLLGGFHASHQDGNLRIDYTASAVAALLNYLDTLPR